MKTIQQNFQELAGRVGLNRAHASQQRECRRMFFAGFHACLMSGIDMANESGENDDVGATMIQRLHDESAKFVADMLAGRA